jgi:glycosyltransferase involved in cell wall biosynthesis
MKIAYFTDSYYPMLNGVTISIDYFTQELRKKKHTVYIFSPEIPHYSDKRKDVYRFSSFRLTNSEPQVRVPIIAPHEIIRDISQMDFDIVHAHGNGFFSLLGYQVAKMKGIPYIATFHTEFTQYTHYFLQGKVVKPKMMERILKLLGNLCDAVITPSVKMKEALEQYGVKKPITVIPNFIHLTNFKEAKSTGYLRKRFRIPPSAPLILSVGRMGYEKNFPFLIKAFEKLSKEEKTAHLVLIGHGIELDTFQTLAKELNVSDRVHFTGKILGPKMPSMYKEADIFVFPSKTETQGMVVLEAAAAGLPLIVGTDNAYKDMVDDQQNGYVVPYTLEAFVQAMHTLIDNPDLRAKFGKRSEEIAWERFQPNVVTDHLVELYEHVLSKHIPRRKRFSEVNRKTFQRVYELLRKINDFFEVS